MGDRDSSHHPLLPTMHISRKLGSEADAELNLRHSDSGILSQVVALSAVPQCLSLSIYTFNLSASLNIKGASHRKHIVAA